MKKERIALLLIGVSSLHCGGAERFFADFFQKYSRSSIALNRLFFFIDQSTSETLQQLGKLEENSDVILLKNVSNRFKRMLENIDLLWKIVRYRISLIHVTNYGRNYYDRLSFVSKLPRFIRPKVVVNIVDCEIAHILSDPHAVRFDQYSARYMPLFKNIEPDGYFSWYALFCEQAKKLKWVKESSVLESASTRFADTEGYVPAKNKTKDVVYAARLTAQKRPMMFVEAVQILQEKHADLIKGWRFHIYGDGPLHGEIGASITKCGLHNVLYLHPTTDLRKVLDTSSCYVSTQEFENFPSLAMNEAMSAGNVIVACNVGQTNLFVEDSVNGFLSKEESANGIAEALVRFLQVSPLHEKMQSESVRLTRTIHTVENFIRQIDSFWSKVIRQA